MSCKHERIKSVNCVLFCDICGEKLPAEYLTGKQPTEEAKAVNDPKNWQETAMENVPENATATKPTKGKRK